MGSLMMKSWKKRVRWALALLIVLLAGGWAWWHYGAPTRIALVNFSEFQSSGIVFSNPTSHVRYTLLKKEAVKKFGKYDFVLVFGMGLDWNEEERAKVLEMEERGRPIQVIYPTSPENVICGIDSLQAEKVLRYIDSGGRRNFANFAHYVRKYIDGKRWFTQEPDDWQESPGNCFYHLDEEVAIYDVGEFEEYLRGSGYYREGAEKVLIIGGVTDPYSGSKRHLDSLILSLHESGLNVYPVTTFTERLEYIEAVQPDLIIYLPHGRLAMGQGERGVELLRGLNVPVLAPINMLQSEDKWRDDPMGLVGGFLSQSVATPEMDGATYPYALFSQEVTPEGLSYISAIPHRLERFTELVHKFLSLKEKPNREKRIAIYYYKGPGQEALAAQGIETVPSLYNMLKYLQSQGYNLAGLPTSVEEFREELLLQGETFEMYDEQDVLQLRTSSPALIPASRLSSWIEEELDPELVEQLYSIHGEVPGKYSTILLEDEKCLMVPRLQYGNIAIIPQPLSGIGTDRFQIIHGAHMPPPYPYVAAYLWGREEFMADAIMHFGTHGSLEFTPSKQVALGDTDWADQLLGSTPHFYYYTIGNVGEGIIAKRRSYATTFTYLTPPFSESGARGIYKELQEAIGSYYGAKNDAEREHFAREVKQHTLALGVHRELRLNSIAEHVYSEEDIRRIDNFAEEIATEKISGSLYTAGVPYSTERLNSTVVAMSADPIAYSKAKLDNMRREEPVDYSKHKRLFNQQYLEPAKVLVGQILRGRPVDDHLITKYLHISTEELKNVRLTGGEHPMMMGSPNITYETEEERIHFQSFSSLVQEAETAMMDVLRHRDALLESPRLEMEALANALAGGYIAPTSGGDAVANPSAVPTGRNLYSINAEATPTKRAWQQGVELAKETIDRYRSNHDGTYPVKVSYTFWSSEFIESEGSSLAQALYLLGVEPVWDTFGRVKDLRLIPATELGRPRIDVVVQTSGQFRDIAASRLALLTKGIEMAASASDEEYDNFVHQGSLDTERRLVEAGMSPKEARTYATRRIFGGINGMYGTGIQEVITAGDKWTTEEEIAEIYLNNMGASYATIEEWGEFSEHLFRAALANTDVVIQPRQSNNWGALSLDHVYEFMGGLTLTVRHVTGKDPDVYFSDYRNRNNYRMQDLKEAIGVESRTTILNPSFVKEMLTGGASSLSRLPEIITNTYGWNVAKPEVIEDALWNDIFEVYLEDSFHLGVPGKFESVNPHAMQETTAVMLETIRKGMWKASPYQRTKLAEVHATLATKYGIAVGGMGSTNEKLQDFIADQLDKAGEEYRTLSQEYSTEIKGATLSQNGMLMSKEEKTIGTQDVNEKGFNGLIVVVVSVALFVVAVLLLRRKRR